MVISGKTFYPPGVKRTEEEKNIPAGNGRCFWCVQKGHRANGQASDVCARVYVAENTAKAGHVL